MRWLRRRSSGLDFYMRHKTRTTSIFENQLICSVGIRADRRLASACQNRFHVLSGSAAPYSCQESVKIEGVRGMKGQSCCSAPTPFSRYETQLTELFFHDLGSVWILSLVTSVTPNLQGERGLLNGNTVTPL